MSFLILLVAVLAAEFLGAQSALQRDQWFARWGGWLASRDGVTGQPWLLTALLVLGPVVGLAVVLWLVGGWLFGLPWLAISLVVLLYSFGRGEVDISIGHYRDELARGDVQGAWHEAASLDAGHSASQSDDWPDLHDRALSAVSYHYFERYFPVIFWFVVLGAPGALLYRLASLAASENDASHRRRLPWLLDWIPVRLLGALLALVGNFAAASGAWRKTFFAAESDTAEVLAAQVRGALVADPALSPQQGAEEVDAVAALFRRALILALGLVALLTLFI